jgi:hypothetical protein
MLMATRSRYIQSNPLLIDVLLRILDDQLHSRSHCSMDEGQCEHATHLPARCLPCFNRVHSFCCYQVKAKSITAMTRACYVAVTDATLDKLATTGARGPVTSVYNYCALQQANPAMSELETRRQACSL